MNYDPDTLIGMHIKRFKSFYEDGLLDPEVHHRLVENAVARRLQ